MQRYALSDTPAATEAASDKSPQPYAATTLSSTMLTIAAAANSAAQLGIATVAQTAASSATEAAVTHKNTISGSKLEHNSTHYFTRGCDEDRNFVPAYDSSPIPKGEAVKTMQKERRLDHIVKALQNKQEPIFPPSKEPSPVAMQISHSEEEFEDDFEIIDPPINKGDDVKLIITII